MGMDMVDSAKGQWRLLDTGGRATAKILPSSAAGKVLQPEERQILDRIRRLEEDKIGLERDRGRLERMLEEEQTQRTQSDETLAQKAALLEESTNKVRSPNEELDQARLAVQRAGESSESDRIRASLAKRVAELEHLVERKVSEIASAIGESKKREELSVELEEIMKKEAETRATLNDAESRLDEVLLHSMKMNEFNALEQSLLCVIDTVSLRQKQRSRSSNEKSPC